VHPQDVEKWERGECICPDPEHDRRLRMCPIHGIVAEEARGRSHTPPEATSQTSQGGQSGVGTQIHERSAGLDADSPELPPHHDRG
jgi:hypothetical protein